MILSVSLKAQDFQRLMFGSMRNAVAATPDLRRDFDNLITQARRGGTVKVIVGLSVDQYRSDSELGVAGQRRQRSEIDQKQIELLERLRGFDLVNVKRFDYIPFIAMELSADALMAMRSASDITSIQEDMQQQASLLQAAPLVGAPTAWGQGFTGQGRTVAVLDTGVDKFHPFFNNRVVSEACYSTTSATTGSTCPGGVSQSTAANSGVN